MMNNVVSFRCRVLLPVLLAAAVCSCERRMPDTRLKSKAISEVSDTTGTVVAKGFIPELPTDREDVRVVRIPAEPIWMYMEDVVESYEFVPLETSPECLIGSIDKIMHEDGMLLILDMSANQALCFDEEGRFVCRYGDIGRACNEYMSLTDVEYDRRSKEVILVDRGGMKILRFSHDGRFKSSAPMFFYIDRVCMLDGLWAIGCDAGGSDFPSAKGYSVLLSSESQEVFGKTLPKPNGVTRMRTQPVDYMSRKGDKVYYKQFSSDTVWSVSKERCKAEFVVLHSDGGHTYTDDEVENMTMDLYFERTHAEEAFLGEFAETENHYFFHVRRGSIRNYIVSKRTGREYCSELSARNENDLFNTGWIVFNEALYDNEAFIKILNPDFVCWKYNYIKERGDISQMPQVQRRLMERLSPEDNPVLMLVRLKPF